MQYKTEQEKFWAGTFGEGYRDRNSSNKLLNSKIAMWGRMLKAAGSVQSVSEFGCNIGLNLLALHNLNPNLSLTGYEINDEASNIARSHGIAKIETRSIIDTIKAEAVDLVFTAGVLIHINPDHLNDVYTNLYECSQKYILIAEYYNPTPVMIPYHGQNDRLFKRDFAGDLIEKYNMKLIDYGFVYKRDNWAPQDDITWFLLQK